MSTTIMLGTGQNENQQTLEACREISYLIPWTD